MDVFCIGMPRSASTWQYAVVCELVKRHRGGRRMGYVTDVEQMPIVGSDEAGDWRVYKSHAPPSKWLARQIASGSAVAVYSYRDLRNVAFSLAHKLSTSFEQVVVRNQMLNAAMAADEFWHERTGVCSQRYETIVADPAAGASTIADHLGIAIDDVEASGIAQRHSWESNKARADALAGRLRDGGADLTDPANALVHDPNDLLHWNHIRDGSTGDWRAEATGRQVAVLALVCGPWLVARGYEPDMGWARAGLEYLAGTSDCASGSPSRSDDAETHWEVYAARMELRALAHRQMLLLAQAAAEGTPPNAVAAVEAAVDAHLAGMREAMGEYARELEAARLSAAHLRRHHDAVCADRDTIRGRLAESERELAELRRQRGELAEIFRRIDDLRATFVPNGISRS